MSLSMSASRPGPLCEWPLDRFLPSSSNSTQVKFSGNSRPNKRPLSPGGPNLFSPTKRRILTQEGIFSPEKTIKSSFGGRGTLEGGFSDLVRASGSPATFGRTRSSKPPLSIPKRRETNGTVNAPRPLNPVKATFSSRFLSSSPELVQKTNVKSTSRCTFDDDDFFATPERLSSSLSRPLAPALFTELPLEFLPPSDPQSIHYPGFVVYRDVHIPALKSVVLDSPLQDSNDCDEWKENVAPRRKIKKAISDPVDGIPASLTPGSKKLEMEKLFKAKLTPATPRKTVAKERQEIMSPTPRCTGLRSKAGTPVISEEEKRRRRRMLKDEVDGVDEDDI